jgi:hypothetical protein
MNFDLLLDSPVWLQILIIGVAAWSVFQLLAFDTITHPLRARYLNMGGWRQEDDPEWKNLPEDYRIDRALFLTCPYCAGFWIWLMWFAAWLVTSWTLVPALAIGGRAIVIAGHRALAKDEDR